jgi:hypothetical protein
MATKKKSQSKQQKVSFWTFRWSVETLYWLILLLLILAIAAWVLHLTVQTQAIYDQVQLLNTSS